MAFDALTMAAVRDELRQKLLGGRVQKVFLISELALGLEIYAGRARHWLFISAHPQNARVQLSPRRLGRVTEKVTPLLLLLRKHGRDSRLEAIEQPAWERVLELHFAQWDEESRRVRRCRLVVEIMGRHSNAILVNEEGLVLEALKRVGPELSRYRVVQPHKPYVPPPRQDKVLPEELTAGQLAARCRPLGKEAPLWQALVAGIAGFSPLLAREVAFRATGNASARLAEVGASWEAVAAQVREFAAMAREGRWAPGVALSEKGEALAFAPYPLTHYPTRRDYPSISEALDAYYAFWDESAPSSLAGAKERVKALMDMRRERGRRRQEALERALTQGAEAERLRQWGEYLLAYAHAMAPGQTTLEVEGQRIPLEAQRGPVEQAQAYFKAYRKAQGALREVPALLEGARREMEYLDQLLMYLELAATPAEVQAIKAEVGEPGRRGEARQRPARAVRLPLARVVSADGFEIWVGKTGRQNEEITFGRGAPEDLWLHARGVPGAHVLIRTGGRPVPERTVAEAAGYAAYHSQARAAPKVAVDYTPQKFVRRIPGGPPGLVRYSREQTIYARPTPLPAESNRGAKVGSPLQKAK